MEILSDLKTFKHIIWFHPQALKCIVIYNLHLLVFSTCSTLIPFCWLCLNCRNYNPRLFRLQHKLDTTDEQDMSNNSVTSSSDRTRDSKKVSLAWLSLCLAWPCNYSVSLSRMCYYYYVLACCKNTLVYYYYNNYY